MNLALNKQQLRITALWAFSEALLGGILHALQVPFSGLFLSAFAAVSLCAIASKDYTRGKLLHATILVMIVKFTLSPHTPFTAYFAVLLQGSFAELMFLLRFSFRIAAYATALFALMESACQKLLVLTLLFGMEGWKALDNFLNSIPEQFHMKGGKWSLYIISGYLLIYFVAGLVTGAFTAGLSRLKPMYYAGKVMPTTNETARSSAKSIFLFIAFLIAVLLFYKMFTDEKFLYLFESKILNLLLRAAIILLTWYFIISPALSSLMKRWLQKKKNAFSGEVAEILLLLPEIKNLVLYAWMISAKHKGPNRYRHFIIYTVRLIIINENENIYSDR